MPQSLHVIAEISIAFAGFSGLIVAFRRNVGPLTEVQKFRLRILLSLAFGALFLALLPELLQFLGVTANNVWRFASTAALLYSVIFIAFWFLASRRIAKFAPEIFDEWAFRRMALGHGIVALLLVGVITSLVRDKAAGIYLATLIWYLVHAAQQFARMLFIRSRGDLVDDG